jgi:hypothetical protein
MIDKSRWDDCISHAVNGNLNACSWYLDIVCPGWCALVEDDYEKVFPLPISSRAGIKYIMQPYFTQQLGLFYRSFSTGKIVQEFLDFIPRRFKYIDINLNTSNKIEAGSGITEMTNLELDLISEYDKIASEYQNNLQRNLKKVGKNALSLSKHVGPEDIISLFKVNKGQDLKHLGESQYQLIQHIAYEAINKGIAEVWGAFDEFNQLVAGILWVTSHQKATFLFSAVSETGKKLNAMPWLIDSFIRENAGNPLTLDFEGSNDPGLARFYSSFGAKKVEYQRYYRNSLPSLYRIALNIWRLGRGVLNKFLHL